MILQSTPVLFVDSIEPSEAFFRKLGFRRSVEVGDEESGEPGFVILTQEGEGGGDAGIGVMLQTRASAAGDMATVDAGLFEASRAFLFMSVPDLGTAERALEGHEQFMPRRDTFYGATEIGYREPGGHHVVLAQFAANSPDEA